MEEEVKLKKELESLKEEHKQLDSKILIITKESIFDQLLVQRLKRRKLFVKDRIEMLHALLYDDIIA